MQPIYKLNSGNGAQICITCRNIIHTGEKSEHLLCPKCQKEALELLEVGSEMLMWCSLLDKSGQAKNSSDKINEFLNKELDE